MPPLDEDRLLDLLAEWEECRQQGRTVTPEELCPDDAVLLQALRAGIAEQLRIERMLVLPEPSGQRQQVSSAGVSADGKRPELIPVPTRIGRYRGERLLGRGGFGLVYLAQDEQLSRLVAIKVLHPELVSHADQAESFRAEARSVASLDHPHIVPVYDVGSTDEFPCFVVSKYIEGISLASRLKQSKLSFSQTAQLIATVADALHYAHKRGFVHRDVKPANILLTHSGEPFVIDFGLALQQRQQGSGRRFAGTPAYMSPEQARGEAHRVDGRSDIFSLGGVLYEMLVGHRPFAADSDSDLLAEITTVEPRPPRQIDDRVPRELERICLKALAKRSSERYTTAKDLADDLRTHLQRRSDSDSGRTPNTADTLTPQSLRDAETPSTVTPSGNALPIRIVPKGLRSFDEHDASFFLELLPGPRDREGLPDSIRFWKTHVEETDADRTFAVGLLYGPSGSGKSSQIKAGLIPRLAEHVVCIYLEATADETEQRLLASVRRKFPEVPRELSLKETLASIREQMALGEPRKVLIVLDQFEQWLHTRQDYQDSDLVQALRECDGGQLQCLVMVRDDFWMAATRFMRELEIPLVEGGNSNAIDLFTLKHARKVLAAFGRAQGNLPAEEGDASAEQRQFLDQAVRSLADSGLVISVRLALFAEMMKGQPWTPATLQSEGGTDGLGFAFLEATFSAVSAPPAHRYHQRAARAVLKTLLPEAGTDIKGHRRGHGELLEASGYSGRPREFDELLHILDGELRLITPTDPEGDIEGGRALDSEPQPKCYQLTHDYLVPSLRDWLTRKQRESWRGRAELKLAERTSLWLVRPESRTLPSLVEFLKISLFTSHRRWTAAQRRMMWHAGRNHLMCWGTVTAVLFAVGCWGLHALNGVRQKQVEAALDAVQKNEPYSVSGALRDLRHVPREMAIREAKKRQPAADGYEKVRLTFALAELGEVDSVVLCSLVKGASGYELDHLVTAFQKGGDRSLDVVRAQIREFDAGKFWNNKAAMAIVALYLGDDGPAADMCQIEQRPDPVQRICFIESFAYYHGDVVKLVPLIKKMKDPALRSALCIAFASLKDNKYIVKSTHNELKPLFTEWFQSAPDSITHNAAGLPLFYWVMGIPMIESTGQPVGGKDWYINTLKMTMVRIPPPSASNLADRQATEPGIGESKFFLSDREVSQLQFNVFLEDPLCPAEEKPSKVFPPDLANPFLPARSVNWFDTVMFCNWLSRLEGLPPCYERTGDRQLSGESEWRLVSESDGYRLPTDAEWEFACRAGTTTEYSFGTRESFRGRAYANVYSSLQVCAIGIPNGWGLFDMHGNVGEWTNDWSPGAEGSQRSTRGSSYLSAVEHAGSSNHRPLAPQSRLIDLGFRVGRTLRDDVAAESR